MRTRALLAVVLLVVGACAPVPDRADTLVEGPRVLAVRATPAEVAPGDAVALEALVASPEGPIDAASARWRVCRSRRRLVDPGIVALDCLGTAGTDEGATLDTVEAPREACRLFGPDPPLIELPSDAPAAGVGAPEVTDSPEPPRPGRPAEPDFTGGFQLPIVLDVGLDDLPPSVFGVRLTCTNPGATRAQAALLGRFGHKNTAPMIDSLSVQVDDGPRTSVPVDGRLVAPQGARLGLRVSWANCPAEGRDVCGDSVCGPREDAMGCARDCADGAGCTGAERYVFLDPALGAVAEREERLRLSWWSTAGRFKVPRNAPDAAESGVENELTIPDEPGEVWVWVVVRDERGGVDFRALVVDVQ